MTQATTQQLDAMRQIGSEWSKGTMHRVYFNDLPRWYGLEATTYKSGNVSSAKFNGETISNSRARELMRDLSYAKLWFDVPTDTYQSQDLTQAQLDEIVSAIRAEISRLMDVQ